jgi:hypothetical protein
MNTRAQIRLLGDGKRLHLSDGPIDIVLQAFGATSQVHEAYRAASDRFLRVLDELCAELAALRAASFPSSLADRKVRRMFRVATLRGKCFHHAYGGSCWAVAKKFCILNVAAPDCHAYVNDGRYRTTHWRRRALFS